jgi:superfamily II DNA/RNA helicase
MKHMKMKRKPGTFNSGGKFKRFKWKKNKNKNESNATYGMNIHRDENEIVNENLFIEPVDENDIEIEGETNETGEGNELSNEQVFAKLKEAESLQKQNQPEKKKIIKTKPIKEKKKDKKDNKKQNKDKDEDEEEEVEKKKKTKKKSKDDDFIDDEDNDDDTDRLITKKTKTPIKKANKSAIAPTINNENDDIDEMIGAEAFSNEFKPVFELDSQGNLPKMPDYVYKMLKKDFGHDSFRPHQAEAILRIACGLSTLIIMSTGYGKSLIYQMAARLYSRKYLGSVVLVISPLISLMKDQMDNMSSSLNAVVCNSQMSEKEYHQMIEDLNEGKINILFMSPEAIMNDKIKKIPRLAFVCIDEVHCLSQWSHNFRPSYLQICKLLKDNYNVKCILGLTATATHQTIEEIKTFFDIKDGNIVRRCDLPSNLFLTVSKDRNKEQALMKLLTSDEFSPFTDHMIIYCGRQKQTEQIAQLIRSRLQNETNATSHYDNLEDHIKSLQSKKSKTKTKSNYPVAEAYHAGLTAAARKRIQNHFIQGNIKIIVATVAFGMGIDMCNIRSVIHFNMPKAIESYVQEIGRAGRDGQLSR